MASDTVITKDNLEKKPDDFILARDPNVAMQEMMQTIDALREIFVEENDALFKADTGRFMSLQDRKIKTAIRYQSGARQFIERKEEIQKAAPDVKQKLQEMHEDFQNLTSENVKALGRLRKGVERLNGRVMDKAKECVRNDAFKYSSHGQLEKNERPVSLGLNESA